VVVQVVVQVEQAQMRLVLLVLTVDPERIVVLLVFLQHMPVAAVEDLKAVLRDLEA
jgi:hypothetical protein